MSGCWAGANGDERFEEIWMKPDSGSVLGVSRTIKNGKTVFTEYVQVRAEGGEIVMHVQLRLAGKTTPFKLVHADGKEAVFANPDHDFPQRIIYKMVGADGLFARVEGPRNGRVAATNYPMKRTSCR